MVECVTQPATVAQFATELRGRHPQGGPGALYYSAQARASDPQRQCRAEHAFIAYQPDFKWWMAGHDRHERDNTSEGKVDIRKPLISLAKYGPNGQIYRLGEFQDPLASLAWQALDQAVDYLHRGCG